MSKYFGSYLDGVKECEEFYDGGMTFTWLEEYISTEKRIVDYRWYNFIEGFEDAIEHFKRLESIFGGEE